MRDCIERKRSAVRRRRRVSQPVVAKPKFHTSRLCIGAGIVSKSVVAYPGRSVGFRAGGKSENERTKIDDRSEVRGSHSTKQPTKVGLDPQRPASRGREGDPGQPTSRQSGLAFGTAENGAAQAKPLVGAMVRGDPVVLRSRGQSHRSMKGPTRRRRLVSNPRHVASGIPEEG